MELLGILSVNEEGIVKTESQGVSLKENLDILLDSSPLASLKRALLWNSQTINGVPYDPRLESVNVHLKLLVRFRPLLADVMSSEYMALLSVHTCTLEYGLAYSSFFAFICFSRHLRILPISSIMWRARRSRSAT